MTNIRRTGNKVSSSGSADLHNLRRVIDTHKPSTTTGPNATSSPDSFGNKPAALPTTSLDASTSNGRPGGVVTTRAGHQATGRDAVVFELDALRAKLALAIQALPDQGAAAGQAALDTSAARVLEALDGGRISIDEARRAAHMLSEMTGALLAIEQGHCTVTPFLVPDQQGVVSFDVHTADNDVLRVSARLEGSAAGQARLKFYNVMDDGNQVRPEDKMMMRFDLEGSELEDAPLHTAIDVQLGHEKGELGVDRLNKKIHGILLDEAGQPVLNRLGNTVPDHHFGNVPDSLNDRASFKAFVQVLIEQLRIQAGDPS
ncbi:MAG: hypothetical protein ABIJ09_13855 [Pseudomonadota bacterium]